MLLLHFPKGGGSSGVREATAIVAASDSVHKDKADYVCTGGSDQITITQAVNDLPSRGGTVYLMEGTYYFSGAIGIINKDRVRLTGCGPSTLLYKPGSGDLPTMFINVKNSDDVIVSNVAVAGNNTWYLSVQNCNTVTINGLIFGNNSRLYVMSSTENITVKNCVFHGLYMNAAYMNRLRIQNNMFYVPLLLDHVNDVIVEGNTFYSVSDPYQQFTIRTSAPSNVVIANNTFSSIYYYDIILCGGGNNYTISKTTYSKTYATVAITSTQ